MTNGIIQGWTFEAWRRARMDSGEGMSLYGEEPHRASFTLHDGDAVFLTIEEGDQIAQYDVTMAVAHYARELAEAYLDRRADPAIALKSEAWAKMRPMPASVWVRTGGEAFHTVECAQRMERQNRLGMIAKDAHYEPIRLQDAQAAGYQAHSCIVLWRMQDVVREGAK